MSFWSSDLAEPGADELAAWLRNVEGSPFGGYDDGAAAVDEALAYYRQPDGVEAPAPTGEAPGEDDLGRSGEGAY